MLMGDRLYPYAFQRRKEEHMIINQYFHTAANLETHYTQDTGSCKTFLPSQVQNVLNILKKFPLMRQSYLIFGTVTLIQSIPENGLLLQMVQ